jgi:hypothetical protein
MKVDGTESMETKFPDIDVQLTGNDGNAFAILGNVTKCMRRAKNEDGSSMCTTKDIDEFLDEARSGDYDKLLRTAMKWVNVS